MKLRQMGETFPSDRERLARSSSRPEWFRKWIENKGRYVKLECGCKEDINVKGILILGLTFPQSTILCERHNAWTRIRKAIGFNEYAEIPPKEISEVPLF